MSEVVHCPTYKELMWFDQTALSGLRWLCNNGHILIKTTQTKPIMNTTPQNVTERYVSNLIHYGRNKEFDIAILERVLSRDEDEEVVGVFFRVSITKGSGLEATIVSGKTAAGATIAQAVRRALEKHGVTFR